MNKLETVSEKIKLFCEYSEAFKINPIIVPHLIEESIKNELDQKAKIIFESMKNIWYFLKQNYSTYEIENTLFTNKLIIEKLKKRSDNIQFKTLRIDFLIDKNNHPKICELNIDSSIGMAESQYFAEIYLNEMGLENSTFSPFSQLGYLIKNLSTQKEINKICLFDLSIWENTGYFNLNHMMDKLRIHLPNMEIFSANEKDILSKVDNKTLVYRVFPDDDYFEYQEIIDCLENNCAEIISEVEYGIFGNKIWLYLLQCDKFKDVIGSENFKIIKSIIPETFLLNENNIHPILEDKNNYFFKNVTGFGGKSVFDGKNTEKDELFKYYNKSKAVIAQKSVDKEKVKIITKDLIEKNCHAVYAAYYINEILSGFMIRTNEETEVVNATNGNAYVGWCLDSSKIN